MKDVLRPILELTVVFPGLLLAYFPVRSYLKQSSAKLAVWEVPLLFGLCLGGGLFCYHFGLSTAFPLLLITIVTIFLYLKTLRLSLWKSGTIALAVCAVFACLNSLSRAVGTAITIRLQLPPDKPWFCFSACCNLVRRTEKGRLRRRGWGLRWEKAQKGGKGTNLRGFFED